MRTFVHILIAVLSNDFCTLCILFLNHFYLIFLALRDDKMTLQSYFTFFIKTCDINKLKAYFKFLVNEI